MPGRKQSQQIQSLIVSNHNYQKKRTYGKCPERPDRALTKHAREPATTDPDFDKILNAWPTLPPYLKAAILALASTECG
jgi:hypothetical protein